VNGVEQVLIGGVAGGTTILYAALGELIGERAGVVNLGTEGCMLSGALAGFATGATTGSAWIGVLAGFAAGALCGLLHAFMVVFRRADQLASGLVIWFLALGVTSVYGTKYIDMTVPPLARIDVPGLSGIPWVGPILFEQDALVYASYGLVALVWLVMFKTRVGLVLRATGERPEVVAATGGRPRLVQTAAVMIGAGLAGVGGAELSVGYVDNWFNDMTNGYGFVAVAVVLFAGWKPLRVLAGSYLFGIALASASVLQAHGVSINQYLLDSLPYVITLVALVLFTRRGSSQAPEALSRALTNSA
jgi:ABC-type uncharacterized transport system permease subunit